MTKRLLVLGAGRHQKDLIARAEQRGIDVVTADYYPDSPGQAIATHPTTTSSLDVAACISVARKYAVDGVMTSGTDQALVTMAAVADALDLPCCLTPRSAYLATNKAAMSEALQAGGANQAAKIRVSGVDDVGDIELPVVVKPADSQGQRGTRKVSDAAGLSAAVAAALAESRVGEAIVEQFIAGYEITVSAWARDGRAKILMVTDRVTYNPPPAIGICFQHVYPSLRGRGLLDKLRRQVEATMRGYGVTDGPLYIQMMVAGEDVYVVEATCRVGGGHEASLIPLVSGVDVIDRLLDLAMTGTCEPVEFDFTEDPPMHALVCFLLGAPGTVAEGRGFDELIAAGRIEEGGYYVKPGYRHPPITNSLGRVGYFIASAKSREALLERTRAAYMDLHLAREDGGNMLFWPDAKLVSG